MVFPYNYCTHLNKSCVKLEDSACCSKCICACWKCVNTQPEFSEVEWKQLIQAQQEIHAKEMKIQEEIEVLMAQSHHLQKQEQLLQKRAGDFITQEIKEIKELEKLEEEEQRELNFRAQDASVNNSSLSENLFLPQLLDSQVNKILVFSLSLFDVEIPESSQGSSSS